MLGVGIEERAMTETLTDRSIASITSSLNEFGYNVDAARVRQSADAIMQHGKTPQIGQHIGGSALMADIVDLFIARQLSEAGLIDRDEA
jgi:hypothetical protein